MDRCIEIPSENDVDRIAGLFHADMLDQRLDVSLEHLLEVAEYAVREGCLPHGRALCWVCRERPGGPAVGVIFAHDVQSLKFGGRSLWIEELFVSPDARGNGHGRALVETLLDHAEQRGFMGVDIEAYQGNTPAAVLYRTLGFQRMGRERFYFRFGDSQFL